MKKYLIGILVTLTLVLGVGATFLCLDGKGKAVEAEALVSSSYGFYVNTELVTTDNLSGEGWSYNPITQTLTLGEEGKSFTFSNQIVEQSNFHLMHTIGGNNVRYGAIIQPETIASDYLDCKEVLRPTENSNRPTKLKIVVKGNVQLGDGAWAGERFNVRKVTSSTGDMSWSVTNQFGGIMWNGDIEISGGGNLQIRGNAYGIYADGVKLDIHDVTVGIECHGTALYNSDSSGSKGELTLTDVVLSTRTTSGGGGGLDEQTSKQLYDSSSVISVGKSIVAKNSYIGASASYNRNNSTSNKNSLQSFTALRCGSISLYDTAVDARVVIYDGWKLYLDGNNIWIRGVQGTLHLYDGASVIAVAQGDLHEVGDDKYKATYVGIYGQIRAHGHARVYADVLSSPISSKAIWGSTWNAEKDKLEMSDSNVINDHTEYSIESRFLDKGNDFYKEEDRNQSLYNVFLKFWKTDTLYLRYDENDKPQASWSKDFSTYFSLGSNVINPSDYKAYDGNPCGICVLSGVFIVNLPKEPQVERYYKAESGHLTLRMQEKANYGTIHLITTKDYGVTIEGKGVIEYLDCEETSYGFASGLGIGLYAYLTGGTLTINSGTIKKCKIDGGYKERIALNGGNVNITDTNYQQHILDFNKLEDGTVDPANGGISLRQIWRDFSDTELIDGKYYIYSGSAILGGIFNYVYVQSENSYNYYVHPIVETHEGNVYTYKFQRANEVYRFEPNRDLYATETKKIYAREYQEYTLDAGQLVKYVDIGKDQLELFDGLYQRLGGSETKDVPDSLSVIWFYEDSRDNSRTVLNEKSLSYTIEHVNYEDEYRTYYCQVYEKATEKLLGTYKVDMRVMVMSVTPFRAYSMVGDTVTFSISVDKNDRDNWRDGYTYSWQVDKNDGKGWVDATEFASHVKDFSVTVESEEMFSWKYRAHLYQLIKPFEGQGLADFYSSEVYLMKRGTPSVNFNSIPDEEISGQTVYYSASIGNGYASAVNVYWEYSRDEGKTWANAKGYSGFDQQNLFINMSASGNQVFMSTLVVKTLKNETYGWQIRCVIDDFKQNKTYYSGVHTISLIRMPEIYLETSDTVTVKETDTSLICSCWMLGGYDNILYTQQWQKRVEGSDDWVDIENQTETDYYLLDLTDAAETTYYRCKLTYSFIDGSHDDIVRYSKERQVNVVHAPKVCDDELQDTLLLEGESKDFNIEFTRNATNPYVVQWQTSVDGESWENYGEAKLDTDLTCKKLSFDKVTGIGINYYRAKVTATMNDVFFDTYTKTFKVYTARLSANCDRFAISDEHTATLSVTNTYPETFLVSYEWQYKNNEEWLSVTELGFESANERSILVDEKGKDADLWRCLVTFTTSNGDFTTQVSTVEIARTYLVSPPFIGAPTEVVVWGEKPWTYLDIDFETSDKDFYQLEYSRDGGKTWKKSGGVVASQSSDPLDKFNVGTVTADMDGYLYRVHAWRVYSDFNVTMYGYSNVVKLVVHTGKVSTLEELLTAIENQTTHIQLLSDITLTEPLTFTQHVYLDLNGHVLNQSQNVGSAIIVNGTTVVVTDSAPSSTHTDNTLPLGGVITGGTGTLIDEVKYGGGVYVDNNSTFELRGGTIYNCTADNGGGIYAKGRGNVFIKGGNVVGCTATVNGGGVYCEQSAVMTDGLITNCVASGSGGGFYVTGFTMRVGTIKDCQATKGASVYCQNTFYADSGKVYDTVYVGIIDLTIKNSLLTTAFYDKVTTEKYAYAGIYYAGTSGVIVGGVPVSFLNGTTTYATLIVHKGMRASAPSELCDLDWVNAETRKKYDFTNQVTKTISLRATWSDADNGHTWSTTEIIAKVDADCENAGTLEHWHCNTCGNNYAADKISLLEDITIAAHDHTYSLLIAQDDATCTETGLVAHYECSVCHKLFDEDKVEKSLEELTIAALGHTYGDLIAKVDESCTEAGFAAHYECSECHKLFDDNKNEKTESELVIAAHAHTYGDLIAKVDESCTEAGFAAHYECSECHNLFDENKVAKSEDELTIDKHAHTYGDLIVKVDESCTEAGFAAHYECSECHNLFDENKVAKAESELTIAAHGHVWSTTEIIAEVGGDNCESTGTKAHWHCDACNKDYAEDKTTELTDLTIAATEHNFGDWICDKPATETEKGHLYRECSSCGAKEEKDLDKLSGGCINTSASSFITIDVTLLLAAVLFAIKRKS